MDLEIAGETALCLGSTQGLGYGCAEALAKAGCKVVINGRNEERGRAAAAKLGAHFIAGDLSKDDARARVYDDAKRHLGHISILVTNSDGPSYGPFTTKSLGDWRAAFELCMLPPIDMATRCAPAMAERGYGRIVNISSISVKEPTAWAALACGVKLGVVGALATLAREVADKGVTVNNLLPGPFDTELLRRIAKTIAPDAPNAEAALRAYGQKTPAKRVGTIEEFGAACAFLASRHAGFITGQSVVLDGGLIHLIY